MRNILLLFIFILIAIPCYGANNTWDVQASGGDYTSVYDALITNDTTISVGDTLFIIDHKRYDSVTVTSPLSWDNWNIGGTVILKAADSIRHQGVWDDNKCVWAFDDSWIIDDSGDIVIEGLQIRSADNNFMMAPTDDEGVTVTFIGCIFTQTSGTTTKFFDGTETVFFTWTFINCYWYDWLSSVFICGTGTPSYEMYFYNCTFFTNVRAYYLRGSSAGRVAYFLNCLFVNSSSASLEDGAASSDFTVNYCASDEAYVDDFGGTGNLANKDFILCDTANNNAMLSPLDTICIGTGLDLYDSVTTIDGMNHPRSDDYDIGFSQAPVGGYYEADASDLIFFQIQSGLGANRFYGSVSTAVIGLEAGIGAYNSNIIFYVLNITDSISSYVHGDVNQTAKIDSVVCSLYVTGMSFAAGGDTMMGVNILDTLVDIGEAGTGGTSVECGTSWNQEEEAGGGGTCTDVNWGVGGGDYLSAATYNDSMLFSQGLSTPTWVHNSFSSSSEITDYFNDLADTVLAWQDETERKAGVQSAVGALIVHYNPSSFDCNWTVSTEDGTNIPKFQFWGASLGGWVAHSMPDTETPDFGLHGDNRHGGSRH